MLEPRQIDFLKYYLDKKSKTFSNAYQSALKAGFEEEYAKNLTSLMPKWLSESIEKLNYEKLLAKAEKNIDILLDSEDEKIKADITKFTTGRLGKKRWSDRIEHTGEDGKAIEIKIAKEIADKYE